MIASTCFSQNMNDFEKNYVDDTRLKIVYEIVTEMLLQLHHV